MMTTNHVVSVTVSSISLVTCFILLVSLYQSRHLGHPQTMKMMYIILFAYIISQTIHIIEWEWDIAYNTTTYKALAQCGITTFWCLAQGMVYFLFMLRLYYSFYLTRYALTQRLIISFTVLLIIYGICVILFVINKIMYISNFDAAATAFTISYAIGIEIIDLIISIFLITVYSQKMIKVTADSHINELSHTQFNANMILPMSQQQHTRLDKTAKLFILSFITTIWSQVAFSMFTIAVIKSNFKSSVYETDRVFFYGDGIINPICLFLMFDFNHGLYEKICGKCHRFWVIVCQYKTSKKIKQDLEVPLVAKPTDSAFEEVIGK